MSPPASPRSAASGLAWIGGSFAAACVLSLTRSLTHELAFKAAVAGGDYKSAETIAKTIGILFSSLSVGVAVACLIGLTLVVRSLRSHAGGLLIAALSLQAVVAFLSLLWPIAWLVDSRSSSVARIFDYASIAHGFVYLAFVVTLATGLNRAARSVGVPPPTAMGIVAIVALSLETAFNFLLSIDAFGKLETATRSTMFSVTRFLWPLVAAILAAFVLTARASFARVPTSADQPAGTSLSDPDSQAAARGLDTLRTVVWIRIGVGVLGVVLLRAMVASGSHEAGQGLAWLVFIIGAVLSLVVASALFSIGRLSLARGPSSATLVLVLLGIPIDGWTTHLTTRMLVKPTGFWDSSLHDALEASKTLPTAMIVSSIVSIAAAILLMVTLASTARSVGDSSLEQRATSTVWLAIATFVLLGIGQIGALQGWISIPVLLVTAVGGLILAITVLARVMGIAKSLSARLTG